MKTLGILGGMGPQAGVRFCSELLHLCSVRHGALRNADYPHFLLSNLPVPDLIQSRTSEQQTVSMIEEEIRHLRSAGATMFVMPCNTMHLFLDRFRSVANVPFLSMVEAVCARVHDDGCRTVALLGSFTTMRSGLYTDRLSQLGVSVLLPSDSEQERLVQCIAAVIAGHNDESHTQFLKQLFIMLEERGAEGIILGCTELPLLLGQFVPGVLVYSSLQILAEATADALNVHSGVWRSCR